MALDFDAAAWRAEMRWTAGAIDTRDGGRAISYVDEDPNIRKTYEAALAAEGMKSGMPSWSYTLRTPPEGELEPGGV